MKCPKCKSENVQVQLAETTSKTNKKGNSPLRGVARGTMILATGGLWALTPKADGKEKTKTKNSTFGVCQDCGHTWTIKK
jgi:DNA-directed RNA polymerase subunit M/transcription elongation factor TFIIS